MKQIVQDFSDGEIKIIEAPVPVTEPGYLIVKNRNSVISSGTEKSTVNVGQKNLLGKAKARPDLVKKVLHNVRSQGIMQTYKKVKSKLNDYKLLGYSSSGVIIDVGEGVRNFNLGDRVACGGGEYATHSEYIKVPANLCVKIDEDVDFDEAAFATIGAVSLQGIRQADIKVGESVGVIGLGLIGILTVQILKASGCRVFGLDVSRQALDRGFDFSMDYGSLVEDGDINLKVAEFTDNFGLDAVLITAGTESSKPVKVASEILRDRGSIVIVGDVGMNLERENFYMKELSLKLSRSYGPGRYDAVYEEKGVDYPIGFVRWTEQRNMKAIINLISENKINCKDIIDYRFAIENAEKAYNILTDSNENVLSIVFEYPGEKKQEKSKVYFKSSSVKRSIDKVNAGVIGAGNFGRTYILPNLKRNSNVNLVGIATSKGANAVNVGKQSGFSYSTADYHKIINDEDIDTVFILTRHNLHAEITKKALGNNKNVYVEKPLAIKKEDINEIAELLKHKSLNLMVGFNRRFSSHSIKLKNFINGSEGNMIISYRINAGPLPEDHWLKDADIGGGRIIGEACHFVDYLRFLTGSAIEDIYVNSVAEKDNKVITIVFEDGSVGNILYVTTGDKAFPKERIEIFVDGKVAVNENFKELTMTSNGRSKSHRTRSQDKGFKNEIDLYVKSVVGGKEPPIPVNEIIEVSKWTIEADRI